MQPLLSLSSRAIAGQLNNLREAGNSCAAESKKSGVSGGGLSQTRRSAAGYNFLSVED
jgi:hypothetical protein